VAPGGTLEAPRRCTAGSGAETWFGGPGAQLCEAWTQMGVSINGGTPIAGWFIRENPIKVDDKWGTPIYGNPQMVFFAFKKSWEGWCMVS